MSPSVVCYRVGVMAARLSSISLLAALLFAVPTAGADEGFDASATYRVPLDDAPSRGANEALVTIVEFSDFHCQYCRLASNVVAELLRLYPREVRLVYRHSLLDPEDGTLAAEAALAAAEQGRFWPFHDRLFARDEAIDRAAVDRAAREVGLDVERFHRDLDQGRFRSAVRAEDRRAAELGVSATPVFFINGRPLVGAHGLGTFVQLIEEERSRAESLIAGGVARRDVYHRVTARGRPRASSIPDGADLVPPPRLDPDGLYQVGLGDPSQRKGREEALVTIVEFGDFNCGYCAKVQPVLAELARSYGDEVRFAFRHMPRGSDESRVIAEAALAAGEQGRFWTCTIDCSTARAASTARRSSRSPAISRSTWGASGPRSIAGSSRRRSRSTRRRRRGSASAAPRPSSSTARRSSVPGRRPSSGPWSTASWRRRAR
jgi:protein-disulfide isomerase